MSRRWLLGVHAFSPPWDLEIRPSFSGLCNAILIHWVILFTPEKASFNKLQVRGKGRVWMACVQLQGFIPKGVQTLKGRKNTRFDRHLRILWKILSVVNTCETESDWNHLRLLLKGKSDCVLASPCCPIKGATHQTSCVARNSLIISTLGVVGPLEDRVIYVHIPHSTLWLFNRGSWHPGFPNDWVSSNALMNFERERGERNRKEERKKEGRKRQSSHGPTLDSLIATLTSSTRWRQSTFYTGLVPAALVFWLHLYQF